MLMVRDIPVPGTHRVVELERALFLRMGESLRLEGGVPVVERRDGTLERPAFTVTDCRTRTRPVPFTY